MHTGWKRPLLALAILGVCVAVGLGAYHRYLRKVRIAFIGFRDTTWVSYEEIGRQTPYTLHRLERDDMTTAPLAGYNAVFVWGMGLNLSDEQVAALEHARRGGAKIVPVAATNSKLEEQANLTDEQGETIQQYLQHGGQENQSAMLHYVAHEFAGKDVAVSPVVEKPEAGFFHTGEAIFETLEEFETYLAERRGELPEDAPKIAIVGAFVNPGNKYDRPHLDYFIETFERQGVRVYPIFGHRRAIELLEQVKPDFAVVFPHGRAASGNKMPDLLAELNIPCASALSIFTKTDEWMADERGISGGMLSQSITMPELDGVIEPIAITAQEANERGIQVRTIIKDRIEKFTARTMNWLKLRQKPNSEKRLVIVYYKSPGLSAVAASGLETVPSLWNMLRHLEKEGYDLGGELPESPEALFDLIQTKGKTLGQWAIGAYEKFLEEAEPEFIPAETYGKWFQGALSEKRQEETIELWGAIPGKQMVAERDGLPHLVVSRIQLGNVVIMPQPTVGGGGEDEDEVKTIHGTDQAAPHFYLGAYLWAQHGFKADALVHFGTHGSLEFTYGKSACLSRDCWPDILIGDLPHIYPYIINNVGEALVAKRRSYGVIVSHLTPPFTESGIYGDLATLHEKMHTFEDEGDALLKQETRRTITRMVAELDLARDADLPKETGVDRLLTDDEIAKIDSLIHEMQAKTITDGLHVVGRPYTDEQIADTVALTLGEPGYDTLLEITGHPDHKDLKMARHDLARPLVDGVLAGEMSVEQFFPEAELAALMEVRSQSEKPETAGPMGGAAARTEGDKEKKKDTTEASEASGPAAEAMKKAKEAGLPHSVFCGCPSCKEWVKENPKLAKEVDKAIAAEKREAAATADSHGPDDSHGHSRSHKAGGHSHPHDDGDHVHSHGDSADEDHTHSHGEGDHTHSHDDSADHGHTHAHGGHSHPGHSHGVPFEISKFWGTDEGSRPAIQDDEELRLAFLDLLDNIQRYGDGLKGSPQLELDRIASALEGGYIPPSSGGDALFNPESVPTGRNLYSINAGQTPSEEAWRVGKMLADQILARHLAESGHWPKQVAFTLWGGEFIRGKGTTLAEVMYLIGVRPLRNSRGSVYDVELIPAEELGRPRIDVLVQTSGQFRDAGACRIALLDKAITMVAELPDEGVPNFVRDGSNATEEQLKELGFSPKEAREFSTARIFGSAANQSYGTGIMGMVEKGDTWEDESQIANRYMRNMGGIYRDGETWGSYKEGLLGAAMQGTEVVVQPRSSNTWGPMSLDHVYEFMGGMTASIRHQTGNDPTGYFSDLRTRGRPKATTAVAAIREEARTTLWNPKYLTGMQREDAAAAAALTETVRNMYGWNVMQPSAIDEEMWDETYSVFIDDKHDLAMREYFEGKNPYALQNMTSVMLETARKGYWEPSEEILQNLAKIHIELVRDFGAGCSYETCGNGKLQEFIEGNLNAPGSEVTPEMLADYQASLASVLESSTPMPDVEGIAMDEKIEEAMEAEAPAQSEATLLLAACILVATVVFLGAGCVRPRRATV